METDRVRRAAWTGCFFRFHISEGAVAADFAGGKEKPMGERLKKDILEMTFDLDRFFQPGYVIELCENTYYRGSRNQRALVGTLPQAERFPGMKAAERFIRRPLRCADWKVCICEVCWVLLLVESELEEPDFYWDGRQFSPDLEKALAFSSYRKILSCQKREHLQEASMIDLRIFPRKQIMLAV